MIATNVKRQQVRFMGATLAAAAAEETWKSGLLLACAEVPETPLAVAMPLP
jgi:hypothetical protein